MYWLLPGVLIPFSIPLLRSFLPSETPATSLLICASSRQWKWSPNPPFRVLFASDHFTFAGMYTLRFWDTILEIIGHFVYISSQPSFSVFRAILLTYNPILSSSVQCECQLIQGDRLIAWWMSLICFAEFLVFYREWEQWKQNMEMQQQLYKLCIYPLPVV